MRAKCSYLEYIISYPDVSYVESMKVANDLNGYLQKYFNIQVKKKKVDDIAFS